MSYSDIVATIAMIVSISAVPASGYLSYRYAIKGEKRKEWNSIVTPIRDELINQIDAIDNGKYLYANISRKEILRFADIRKDKNNNELLSAFDDFELYHSFEELWLVNDFGKTSVGDTTRALAASKKLLTFITRA